MSLNKKYILYPNLLEDVLNILNSDSISENRNKKLKYDKI